MFLLLLLSCTDNIVARNYGGTMDIDLPCDQKLLNVTWKDTEVWYLTRPMRADEQPESYSFHSYTSFNVLNGTVILKESNCK
jgi:hypothetical protein